MSYFFQDIWKTDDQNISLVFNYPSMMPEGKMKVYFKMSPLIKSPGDPSVVLINEFEVTRI